MGLAWMIIPWSCFVLALKVIPCLYMSGSFLSPHRSITSSAVFPAAAYQGCRGQEQERNHQKLLMSSKHESFGPGLNLHRLPVPKSCSCGDKHTLHRLSACSGDFSGFRADGFCTLCSEQEQSRHSQLSSSLGGGGLGSRYMSALSICKEEHVLCLQSM